MPKLFDHNALLGALGPKGHRQFERAILNPLTRFEDEIAGHLYDGEVYIPVSERNNIIGRNHLAAKRIAEGRAVLSQQMLFANCLQVAEAENDQQGNSSYPSPSSRVTLGPLAIYTFEFDDPSLQFFQTQLSWLRSKGKKRVDCPMGQFFKTCSQWTDFKGLTVCWSGHKSLHIHAVFDTAPYLARFASPGGAARHGMMAHWDKLETALIADLGLTDSSHRPDRALRRPEQYRRLPNGLREIDKPGHILGIPVGTIVPQLTLWEMWRGCTSRNAKTLFHSPTLFAKQPVRPTKVARKHPENVGPLSPTQIAHCESRLRDAYPNDSWPRVSHLGFDSGYWKAWFFNCAKDSNPNSVMREDYCTILMQGHGADLIKPAPLPATLGECMREWLGEIAPEVETDEEVAMCVKIGGSEVERAFAGSATKVTASSAIDAQLPKTVLFKRWLLLQGPEGASKTSTIMRHHPWIVHHLGRVDESHSILPRQSLYAFGSYSEAQANVFGQGSRTPVAITLMVKNPNTASQGRISFHDIGDYLTREEKLAIVRRFGSIGGITDAKKWTEIVPDEHGDWLGQRDASFEAFPPMGDKEGTSAFALFSNYSSGLKTQRDTWCFNSSSPALTENMKRMVSHYTTELDRFDAAYPRSNRKAREAAVDDFIDTDATKISWTRALKNDLVKGKRHDFEPNAVTTSLYRPFTKQWLYYSRPFNEMLYQMPRIFPMQAEVSNRIIMVKQRPPEGSQLALMVGSIPELQTDGGTQCFPRYLFEVPDNDVDNAQGELLSKTREGGGLQRRDAITDEGLSQFQAAYPGETITKDDLFHYVYGLLHSEDYRDRFADNLSKQLPRIPAVKKAEDFWAFVQAGARLGDLHCDFDSTEPFPVTIQQGDLRLAHIPDPERYYRVEKMKFGGKRPNLDKTTVHYNGNITMTGIPLEAYDYVVNGKPALEWVMERQVVKTDKASGIVNDANRYAIETVGDPAYPLLLFQRVITVSLETMKIVRGLPALDI